MLVVAVPLLICGGAASAQTLSASGNPGLLRISTAVAGSEPVSVSNSVTTYTVTTPNANRTYAITAQLDANMPIGTTLTVTLAPPPPSAVSLGAVTLDVTARNVVTEITRNTNSTQNITYQLSATVAAGVIPSSNRTVTFTIIRFP